MTGQKRTKSEIQESLQATLEESIKAGNPGLSAAINSSSDLLWHSTAGYADLESSTPIDNTHIFGIGSVTKVFVAVVIFQLIDEKVLRLSDELGDLLNDDVLDGIANADEATIEMLLSHSSGIESWEDDPVWIRHGRGKNLDPSHIWSKTEPLKYIRRPNTSGPKPGEWSYSNTGYTLLGLVIEALTHKTAESEIRCRILEPLGMKSTFLEGFEDQREGKLPHRYHWATEEFAKSAGICPKFSKASENLIDATPSNLSVEWSAGGLISSPPDLLKFILALKTGKLISSSSLEVMQAWRPTKGNEKMGHGIFRWPSPLGYGTWIGHFGGVLGFTAALFWLENEDVDVGICVLGNVGIMHCGKVPTSPAAVMVESDFLKLAVELAECE